MTPDNAFYYHAAYVVAGAVYLGYVAILLRRRARARRELAELERRG